MLRKIIFISLSLLVANVNAKGRYETKLLKDLHSAIVKKNLLVRNAQPKISKLRGNYRAALYPIKGRRMELKVVFRPDSVVSHIGLNIFNGNKKEDLFQKFTERILLTKLFNINIKGDFPIERKETVVAFNKKKLSRKELNLFEKFLQSDYNLFYDFRNKEVTINLSNGKDKLTIITPVNLNFLTGMDKRELDVNWLYRLKHSDWENKNTFDVDSSRIIHYRDSLFVASNKRIIEGLDQNVFFFKDGKRYSLLSDKNLPVLSYKNILFFPSKKEITLNLKYHLYPKEIRKIKRKFYLVDKELSEGNEKFVGFEKKENDSLVFLVLYYNPRLMISHLLSISFNEKDCCKKRIVGTAELYTNIRNDNLSDIFKNFKQKKEKFKVKL